jgi:8-oxo-dGTP pyrophosphatase MutT (NUDIX family)
MKTIAQAGAIAFRCRDGRPHVLIVKAKRNPGNLIFPKGHVEPGETGEQAAGRELREEAGVEGKVLRFLGERSFEMNGAVYSVAYYLLRFLSTEGEGEPGRCPAWYPVDEALSVLTFPDARELLKAAVPFMMHE